ncbi:MAG: T9SS type A sorting domain-containing protein [Leadbetterella sp.]|nr:T9SS type A sorting domain-containing protein [Leadbetterella sp.]
MKRYLYLPVSLLRNTRVTLLTKEGLWSSTLLKRAGLLLLILGLLIFRAEAQCPSGNITLNSQKLVNDFPTNYAGCQNLPYSITVNGPDITNLNGLSQLKSIGITLLINVNPLLEDISGLSNVESIGSTLQIYNNAVLKNVTGLSKLKSIGKDLTIQSNATLQNVDGLVSLKSINGKIQLVNNAQLAHINGFDKLESIGDSLTINTNAQLANINGLSSLKTIGGYLLINNNSKLQHLDGLASLTSIGGYLQVSYNPQLTSINGLAGINPSSITGFKTIQGLILRNNGTLSVCNLPNICTYLEGSGPRTITGNLGACIDENAVKTACSIPAAACPTGNVTFDKQNQVDEFGTTYGHCTAIPGVVTITGGDIVNLNGLSAVQTMGYLHIENTGGGSTAGLKNLSGLSSLKTIQNGFRISNNQALEDLEGLSELSTIGGSLFISENPKLKDINRLNKVKSIGTTLNIDKNPVLKNLDGFSSLEQIGENLQILENARLETINTLSGVQNVKGLDISDNAALQHINGLSGLKTISSFFNIANNASLQNLGGLGSLQSITGYMQLGENPLLLNLDGLSALKTVGSHVRISGNMGLKSLSGLSALENIGGELSISYNPELENVNHLSGLKNISGRVAIEANTKLQSLSGLSGVVSIGGLLGVGGNPVLNSLQGLENIDPATISELTLVQNGALSVCNLPNICAFLATGKPRSVSGNLGACADTGALNAACAISSAQCPTGDYTFNSQEEIDKFGATYGHCSTIPGKVTIQGEDIVNLKGLAGVKTIGKGLSILSNPKLANLDGLEALESTGSLESSYDLVPLIISDNKILENINGLSGLSSINGASVVVGSNPELKNLNGLGNLNEFQVSTLNIGYNLKLQQIDGLKGIGKIREVSIYDNPVLANLNGLSGLKAITINLYVSNNPSLQTLNGLSGVVEFNTEPGLSKSGEVAISRNTHLVSIDGIKGIPHEKIKNLIIQENGALWVCNLPNICSYLAGPGPRSISGNLNDCANADAVVASCSPEPPKDCPTGTIVLNTQALVDEFGIKYSHCTVIQGSIMISGPVTNLKGLAHVKEVKETFSVANTDLESLEGLDALEKVGEYMYIQRNKKLKNVKGLGALKEVGLIFRIDENNVLESLADLSALKYSEELRIHKNPKLSDLTGLSALETITTSLVVSENALLKNLNGLSALRSVGTPPFGYIWIRDNPGLENATLPQLEKIGEHLLIADNNNLETLSFPKLKTIEAYLNIRNNNKLQSLAGLEALESTGAQLYIYENPQLKDLDGLSGLKSTGGWYIANNPLLTSIQGLKNISKPGDELTIKDNKLLAVCNLANVCAYLATNKPRTISGNLDGCATTAAVTAACSTAPPACPAGDVSFSTQEKVDDFGITYAHCTSIPGNVDITFSTVQNLKGLKNLKSIGGSLSILYNDKLADLEGLEALQSIASGTTGEKGLQITGNKILKNINGLSGLTSINGTSLTIDANPELINLDGLKNLQGPVLDITIWFHGKLEQIDGLAGITSARGVSITANALSQINGLSGLKEVSRNIILGLNPNLKNLDGLSGVQKFNTGAPHENSGSLFIEGNDLLSSIDGLKGIPSGSIRNLAIKDNGVLSICNLPNICAYLALPSGSNPRSISGNLGNCATEAAVTAVCGTAQQTLTLGAAVNPTLCGAADGRIGFTTSLEAGPYTLSFKRGAKDTTAAVTVANGGFSLTGLGKGIYKGFAITHTEGMVSATGERTLTDPAPYSFAVGSKSDPTGCGDLNGRIVFTTNLDAESYLLRFKKGSKDTTATVAVSAGGFTLSGLSAATYSAFSISSGGCSYLLAGPVELLNPQSAGGAITAGGPLELCEGEQVQLTAPAGASYEWSTGAGGRSIWASTPGVYKVKVKSGQGCISESQITVSRKECNVPPMAVCKPVVVLVAGSDCQALLRVEHLDAGSYDKDNDWFTRSIDINPLLRVGSYKATLTLVDIKGASTSCQSTVHVVDHTAPVIQARSITVSLNTEGRASITPADVDAGSYDGCGGLSLSIDRRDFDCRDLGQRRQVILKGTDASGNEGTAVAFIQVVDNLPPVVTTKAVRLTLDQNGRASLKPEDLAGSMWDNCSIWNVTASKLNFDCNDVGENKVTLRVEDVGGGATEAEVTVTVVDNTPPVLQAQAITLYLDKTGKGGVKAEQVGAASTDNCGLDSLALSRTEFSCDDIGENEIQLKGWDKSGNESGLMITITVADTIRPVIVARDVTLYLDDTGRASLSPDAVDGGSTDNCGIESRELQKTGFSCNERGIHTIQYRVKDKSGNESTAEIRVTVKDTTAPVAQAQDLIVELDGSGKAALTAGEINDGSYDNCAIETMEISQSSFSCSDLGKRLITLTVRDGSGNTGSIRAEILIRDPEGVCPCSYGILAQNKVVLRSNRVHAGGIGVSGSKGMVKLRNTLVDAEGTFVKSERTRFDNESESSVYMRGRAPEPEGFRSNDKKEKKTERVKKNATQTFTAGSYGRIKAKKGAKLIFSGGDVQIRSLKLGKGGQVSFGGATALLVRDYVKLGKETEFNGAGEQVRVYSGGQVKIRSGSEVKGYVHSRGSVKTTGRKEKYLEGFFAGDRIRGSRNTEWSGGGVMCRGGEDQVLQKLEKGERRRAEEQQPITADSVAQGKALWVRIWPNPVRVQMRVEVAGETEGGQVMLVDLMGNVLRQQSYGGRTATLEMQTEKLEPGLYVLRVSSGGEVVTLRIVKNER